MKSLPQDDPAPASADTRAWLSALADGDAQAADRACGRWRDDADARQTWHAYQLIGDVMRSEDLARPAAGDAAFLAGLRERLAAEPVVFAPQPTPAAVPARRRQPWLLPVAAAAGFVVVAGVLVLARVSQPGAEPGVGLATATPPAGVVLVGNPAVRPVNTGVAGEVLLRDQQLDEYLRAHQSARGGVAVAAPGGALRQVELTVPAVSAR